jgi:hypothetical protein
MEGLEKLCPTELGIFLAGGAKLKAVAWTPWDDFLPEFNAELWLMDQLIKAISLRPDLQLTGRILAKGVEAERFRLPHDILQAAAQFDDPEYSELRVLLRLDRRLERAHIEYYFTGHYDPDLRDREPEIPPGVELIAVRVELRDDGTKAPSTAPMAASGSNDRAAKEERLRAWYRERRGAWPCGELAPGYNADFQAAAECLGFRPTRELLRRIRREFWTDDELKPGPHRNRKRVQVARTSGSSN